MHRKREGTSPKRSQGKRARDEEPYEDKEQTFVEIMAACRTVKRIREGREKPVDFLAKAFRLTQGERFDSLTLLDRSLPETLQAMGPDDRRQTYEEICHHLALSVREQRGTLRDHNLVSRLESSDTHAVEVFKRLEWKTDPHNLEAQVQYWEAAAALASACLAEGEVSGVIRARLPSRIEADIVSFLQAASEAELQTIKAEVKEKLRDPNSDPAYWEAIADNLPRLEAERVVNGVLTHARSLLKAQLEERQREMQEEQARQLRERREMHETTNMDLEGVNLDEVDPLSPFGLGLPLFNPYNWNGSLSPRLVPISGLALPCPKLLVDEEDLPWTCSLLKRTAAAGLSSRERPPPISTVAKCVDLGPITVGDASMPEPAVRSKTTDGPGPYSPRLTSIRDVTMQVMSRMLTEEEAVARRKRNMQAALARGKAKAEARRVQLRREQEVDRLNQQAIRDGARVGVEWDIEVADQRSEIFDRFIQRERARMSADEQVMEASEIFTMQNHDWEEKYRPRRPRYFNRVRTGFEWNRYNQTHYDRDNPPPKVVQGYKFTLFFPDLVDPTSTPQWVLEPSDEAETVHIRFVGGPPYEDVVFKILNREWEIHSRHGFKNSFDKGVMQLHFNLKKFKYRR